MKKILSLSVVTLLLLAGCGRPQPQALYVGTYGNAIHILSYDPATGAMSAVDSIASYNASYIAMDGNTLYAVNEAGAESGVSAIERSAEGWNLRAYTSEVGDDPCYILPLGGKVYTANYTGGSFSVYDAAALGTCQLEHFESVYGGECPVPGRQDDAHIHQVRELPAAICRKAGIEGHYLLITDLGNDIICVNRIQEDGTLVQEDVIECGYGAGPRHMEFNERAGMLYCLTELSGELLAWKVSSRQGAPAFELVARYVADEYHAGGSADIHMHPNGRVLYTSHRGEGDGISTFKVLADGTVEKIDYTHTGAHPRNFTISHDGKFLLVACRDTHSIQVYKINKQTGVLSSVAQEYFLGPDMPVCLLFE